MLAMRDLIKEATDRLHAVLLSAAMERDLRPGLVAGPDGSPESECAWAAFERSRMHETVNTIRAENGLGPIALEKVIEAEGAADGHSDYGRKFAYYCAEIALWENADTRPMSCGNAVSGNEEPS